MSQTAPATKSLWRRFRFPLLICAIPVLFVILENLWDRFEWQPAMLMDVGMVMSFSVMLAPLVILIWFLFFSDFTRQSRVVGLLLVAGVIATAVAVIRKVEFTGKMRPIVYFRWEGLPQDRLEQLPAMSMQNQLDVEEAKDDSPFLRGPDSNGITPSAPSGLDWVKSAGEILWQHPVGGGHAGIAVAGQVAITIEQRAEKEAVVAYHVKTGLPCWVHQYPAAFHHSEPMGGDGPRTTPTIVRPMINNEPSAVYCLGAQGHLHCLETATGRVIWKTNSLQDADARNLEWGMSGSPLFFDRKVIVNPGIDPEKKSQQAVIAYNNWKGTKEWSAGSDLAGYASLMQVRLDQVDQLLLFDAAGLKGLDPNNGKVLWLYPWKTSFDMNCAQPIVVGDDQVFISSEVSNGGAMLKVKRDGTDWKAHEVWKNRHLGIKFSNAVLHQGHLYGLGNGYLTCVEAKTGERKWKARQQYGNGQVLLAGDVLVITSEDGYVALCAAQPSAYKELKRIPVFSGRTWNVPAIARGKLYMRNHQEMACVKLW